MTLQTPDTPTATTTGDQAAAAIAFARAQIGKPYQWGATGPNSYDCSGLVQAAYKAAGVNLGRTTYQQILQGTLVPKDQLAPGDLVFPDIGHVQIYTGNGNVIEAPHQGLTVREVPMWGYFSARRVVPPTGATSGTSTGTAGTSDTTTGTHSTSLLNPASWLPDVQGMALKLAIVGAGLALVLLGAGRLVSGNTSNLIGALT